MAKFLKSDTACHIMFGPFLDKTDGVTIEDGAGIITSIDHATTGIFLSKNGGAGAIRHQGVTASVLDAYGMFQVHLDATDTNTPGTLRVMMAEAATFLPVWDDYMVIPHELWDTLFVTQPCAAINKFFDKATPTGTVNSLPDAVAGQASGIAIVGSSMVVPSTQKVDVETIKTQAVTCAAGVTILPSVGAASAQTATLDTIKAETALIVADTNELQVDDYPTSIAAIKTVVDALDTLTKASGPGDLAAILVDTGTTLDGRIPAALVSGRMDSSVGAVAANAIDAAAIKDAAIDMATFAADVGTTAFASNAIALAVFKALDSAIGDAVSLTADGLLEKTRMLLWIARNKIEVTDADGHTIIYKDNSSTEAFHTSAMLTDDATTTTRLRATAA